MLAKSPMLLVFVTVLGCGAQAPPARQANLAAPRRAPEPAAAASAPLDPARTLAEADRAYDSSVG